MSYKLRPATVKDLPILLTFEEGIIKTERAFNTTLKEGEIHYYDLSKMIANENAQVLVVELNSEIVASGFVQILDSEAFNKFDKYNIRYVSIQNDIDKYKKT